MPVRSTGSGFGDHLCEGRGVVRTTPEEQPIDGTAEAAQRRGAGGASVEYGEGAGGPAVPKMLAHLPTYLVHVLFRRRSFGTDGPSGLVRDQQTRSLRTESWDPAQRPCQLDDRLGGSAPDWPLIDFSDTDERREARPPRRSSLSCNEVVVLTHGPALGVADLDDGATYLGQERRGHLTGPCAWGVSRNVLCTDFHRCPTEDLPSDREQGGAGQDHEPNVWWPVE